MAPVAAASDYPVYPRVWKVNGMPTNFLGRTNGWLMVLASIVTAIAIDGEVRAACVVRTCSCSGAMMMALSRG